MPIAAAQEASDPKRSSVESGIIQTPSCGFFIPNIPPADKACKLGSMLILEIVAIIWPCTLHSAIGKELYSTGLAAVSLLVSSEQGTQDLLKDLTKVNPYDRQRAAIALGNAKDSGAVEPLINTLQDEDDFVRSFAARALGNIGDRRAVGPLIKTLGDKHVLVRRSAAQALGSLKDPKAVDPLITALESEDFLVQRSAAEALGEVGGPRAIDALIKNLGNDDGYIQASVASAIVKIGDAAIPKLVAELGESKAGARAAEILNELHWQPTSDQDKARYKAATKNR